MRVPSLSEDVILTLLEDANAGTPIGQLCKTAAISTRTFYRWRAQYGGLTVPAARERNDLLRENFRLRALVEELLRKIEGSAVAGATALPTAAICSRDLAPGRFGSVRGKR